MANDETVTLGQVLCKVETEKAILCIIEGDEIWIPKSQVHDDSEVYKKGDEGKLVVTKWFATKQGWEE